MAQKKFSPLFSIFLTEKTQSSAGVTTFSSGGFQFSTHFALKKKKKNFFFRETSNVFFFYVFLAENVFLSLLKRFKIFHVFLKKHIKIF